MTKRTPLYAKHIELGATMMPFGGWDMPLRYSGDRAEHMAVRTAMGLFDVSHMGEIVLEGADASTLADRLVTNDVQNAAVGQALYACMLNEQGGVVDDLVIYKLSPISVLLCVNASNIDKDVAWVQRIAKAECGGKDVRVNNMSDRYAQVALQGPKAAALAGQLFGNSVTELGRYCFTSCELPLGGAATAIIARTGYTGEDGFEIFCAPEHVVALWDLLLSKGSSDGLLPCGLSARDTLRLEAGMCLYGNDIDDTTTPLEAGLGWTVRFDKPNRFIGLEALRQQKAEGLKRRIVGLELLDRGIARHGYTVTAPSGETIGRVTSGTFAPYLEKPIAMAYVALPHAAVGSEVRVTVRDRSLAARVMKLPFYKRK